MSQTDTAAKPKLTIRRTFDAPRERVFAAWTRPEQMRQWMGPGDITISDIQTDLRVGGTYRVAAAKPDGEEFVLGGVFREVRAPEHLSYTWQWEEENPEDEIETLVTVDFLDLNGRTEVVIVHEGFRNEESRVNHDRGWNASLEKFANLVEA